MVTNGSLSWLLLRGLMLHIGKAREEENTSVKGSFVVYITSVSVWIQIEALRASVLLFSTLGSMAKHFVTAVMRP